MQLPGKLLAITALVFSLLWCRAGLQKNSSNFIERDAFVHVEATSINASIEDDEYWRNRQAFGSGVIVKSDYSKTLVLTAAHVCIPDLIANDDDLINIITVTTWNSERFAGDIIALDMINDLCLLGGGFTGLPYVKTSRILPKVGDKVYNLAAPYGIFGDKFILTFSGIYSGKVITDDEQVYTVPAAPGSSGSPILNTRGHLIGMIHSSTTAMETISIGPSTESIIEFLSDF